MSRYTSAEARILSNYVSNLDDNVYAIFNLPEEVVAVIFAKVSRSPRSFRDNLLELVRDRELAVVDQAAGEAASGLQFDLGKAQRFHEKWVVGYGHSSVAELAVAHVGVERISRLASARLELSNPFLSFVEYSQRYQRPQRGDYYTPPELDDHPELLGAYIGLQELTYNCYEELQAGLVRHLRAALPVRADEGERAFAARVDKVAFEDARNALTLGVYTNLGMTGNGRAIRDSVVCLLSDPYPECNRLAESIRREVSTAVLPVLLKYASPNAYRQETRRALAAELAAAVPQPPVGTETRTGVGAPQPAAVWLRDWTGRGPGNPSAGPSTLADNEAAALEQIITGLLMAETGCSGTEAAATARTLAPAQRVAIFRQLTERLGPFDHPVDALTRVNYEAEFHVSEACWHQLLRHCRRIDFTVPEPGVGGGWVVPPNVVAAGLTPVLERAVAAAAALYHRLASAVPVAASYAVTNAHRRRCLARFTLWELYHLVNLRGSPEAQWEIRDVVLDLARQVAAVHPHLVPTVRRAGG